MPVIDRRPITGLLLAALCLLLSCGPNRGTIGAVVGRSPQGRLFLRYVPADLAAGRAGLQAGDEILLIDGQDVRTLSVEQVHAALAGEVGEPVQLTLVRGTEVVRVTLARSQARALSGT